MGELERGILLLFIQNVICFLVKNDSWNEFEILKKLCEDTQSFLYSLFSFDAHCK